MKYKSIRPRSAAKYGLIARDSVGEKNKKETKEH